MLKDIKNYKEFADLLGNKILCNDIINEDLELINGDLEDEDGNYKDILQFYIIENPDLAINCTDEIIFYSEKLDLYILGVTFCGMSWENVQAPVFHESIDAYPVYC